MFPRIVAVSKQVGFVTVAITAACTAYTLLGLPIPMSEAAVNGKINPIISILSSVQRSQVMILGDLSTVQRQILRNERLSLESALPSATPTNKIAFNLRLGQIEDEIVKLDRRDQQAEKDIR